MDNLIFWFGVGCLLALLLRAKWFQGFLLLVLVVIAISLFL